MTTPRPKCAHCGEPYGNRRTDNVSFKWPAGEPKPVYPGNLIVTKMETIGTGKDRVGWWRVWDGETWIGGYPPFCTLRCALDYARRAFKKHGRIK